VSCLCVKTLNDTHCETDEVYNKVNDVSSGSQWLVALFVEPKFHQKSRFCFDKFIWIAYPLDLMLWSPDTSKWMTYRIPCVSCTDTCLILPDTYQESIRRLNFIFSKIIIRYFPIRIKKVSDYYPALIHAPIFPN
jgi:hypothetical protein